VTALQGRALDLSWLVVPGSVQASLLTGLLGFQPSPTVAEIAIWLAYAVPMTIYVLRPAGARSTRPATSRAEAS